MPRYAYQAIDAQQLTVSGVVEADSVGHAATELQKQGLVIQSIAQVTDRDEATSLPGAPTGVSSQSGSSPQISTRERSTQALLTDRMDLAMQRGKHLIPALEALLQEVPTGARRRRLRQFLQALKAQDSAAALPTFSAFADLWLPLFRAASSERPAQTISEFFADCQNADQNKQSSRGSALYALLVVVAAAFVLVTLSILVIPTYRSVFEGFGLRLRPSTKVVMTVAEWISSGRILVVLASAAIALGLLFIVASRLPLSLRNWFGDRYGTFFGRAAALARFTRYTADLLEAEFPLPAALSLSSFAAGSPRLARACNRLASSLGSVRQGAQTETAIPLTTLHALTAELPHQSRLNLLRELSRVYSDRALLRTSWTNGVLEPLTIVLMGVLVGFVVFALFLPLITLVQGLA